MTIELTVAIVTLRLAYLVVGVALCLIGRSLIERGVSARFEGQGDLATFRFKVATASPGLVFALAGLVVIGLAIFRQAVLPLSEMPGASSVRFASEDTVTGIVATLSQGRIQEAADKLIGTWRSDPLTIAASLAEPRLRPAIEPAISTLLEPVRRARRDASDGTATLESVSARLWVTLQTQPLLRERSADASQQIARLEDARRRGAGDEASALLMTIYSLNPQALLDHLSKTRPEDWPNSSTLFVPLRDALAHAAQQ